MYRESERERTRRIKQSGLVRTPVSPPPALKQMPRILKARRRTYEWSVPPELQGLLPEEVLRGRIKIMAEDAGVWAHGIQDDMSKVRAHVCPWVGRVIVYRTADMWDLLVGKHLNFYEGKATQNDVNGRLTGLGILVPINEMDIKHWNVSNCHEYDWSTFPSGEGVTTSLKGKAACDVVDWLLDEGYFPRPTKGEHITNVSRQRRGYDIVIRSVDGEEEVIQVKCDYRAGLPEWGNKGRVQSVEYPPLRITGNLFVQVGEVNPFKRY